MAKPILYICRFFFSSILFMSLFSPDQAPSKPSLFSQTLLMKAHMRNHEKNVQSKHKKPTRKVKDWHAAIGTISEMKRLGTKMIGLSPLI